MELYEHVRLIYKHLHWAAQHVAEIHNQIKPAEKNEITPDNQMQMFEEEINEIEKATGVDHFREATKKVDK